MWKAIGESAIGIAHVQHGKSCEDAIAFKSVTTQQGDEVLLCCISDGAGSASHAAWASSYVTQQTVQSLTELINQGEAIDEAAIYRLAEELYEALSSEAAAINVAPNEYSCTWLGCIVYENKALYFQIGDGAIIRDDGLGNYTNIWWPHNGEYQNSTCFLVDDLNFPNLHITIIEAPVYEVALFSDGLQMLALNTETTSVHQPFFTSLFRVLRMADDAGKLATLTQKLKVYLSSDLINNRTDDDKTLFLATRLSHEV